MNRLTKTLLLVALVLSLGATQASAYSFTTIFAEGTDAAALESSFLSSGTVITENFESFAGGTVPTISVAMGSITGGGYVADVTGVQYPTDEYAVDGNNYFSNGTPGNLNGKATFTLNLSSSQNSIGFYVMDPVDIGGIMDMTITGSGGTTTLHMLDILGGAQASGDLFYVLLQADAGFDAITFSTSNNDGYGLDRISVASTPIPGAVWLLGAGLMGLVGYRRLRSNG